MLSKFWDAATGKLADRWAGIGAPAVVFWAGGVLAWAFAGAGWSRLSKVSNWLDSRNVAADIAALLGALVVVAASAIVVQRLTTPVLRLLEGYWPHWLRRLTNWRRDSAEQRKAADYEAWQQLQRETDKKAPTAERRADLARLEERRRHRPILDSELMPTRVGNILRAAETRPYHRYGLEAVIVWPRLWLVLPDPARQELTAARGAVDASVAAVIWGLGFTAFTPLAWWATPVGIAVALAAAIWWVPSRAEVFADLVEGAYDLYRTSLYQQLRWPLPDSPADEHKAGIDLSTYLDRGSDKPQPEFTPPPS
jgi:hypothetical protein